MKEAILSDKAPAPIGPYSQAIRTGNLVFVSGQVPFDPATGEMIEGDIQALTRRAMDSVLAILEAGGMTAKNIVKTNIYLADMGDFAAMNEVYGKWLEDCETPPARAAFGGNDLPRGSLVEIVVQAVDENCC